MPPTEDQDQVRDGRSREGSHNVDVYYISITRRLIRMERSHPFDSFAEFYNGEQILLNRILDKFLVLAEEDIATYAPPGKKKFVAGAIVVNYFASANPYSNVTSEYDVICETVLFPSTMHWQIASLQLRPYPIQHPGESVLRGVWITGAQGPGFSNKCE